MSQTEFELRELRHLLAIASEGSFVKAARSLHISQPALSRSIKEIERKAGFRLFDRGREGAEPTDTGRMVVQHAESVLAAAGDMHREVALIRGKGTGDLRIGAGVFPPELFLGEAVGNLLRQSADIHLRVIGAPAPELVTLLRKREVDLIVADPVWAEQAPDIRVIPLSSHEPFLLVRPGHPLIGRRAPKASDIVSYPLVTSVGVPPRLTRDYQPGKTGATSKQALFSRWKPAIFTDSIAMMKRAVQTSDAVTMLSLSLAKHELERGELVVLPVSLSWIQPRFAFMHLSHRTPNPLAEALIRVTTAAAAATEEAEKQLRTRWPRRD